MVQVRLGTVVLLFVTAGLPWNIYATVWQSWRTVARCSPARLLLYATDRAVFAFSTTWIFALSGMVRCFALYCHLVVKLSDTACWFSEHAVEENFSVRMALAGRNTDWIIFMLSIRSLLESRDEELFLVERVRAACAEKVITSLPWYDPHRAVHCHRYFLS